MVFTSFFKVFAGFCLTLTLSPEAVAQSNSWYQQYAPSYYYYQQPGAQPYYQGGYNYNYGHYQAPPAPVQQETPDSKTKKTDAQTSSKRARSSNNNSRWLTDWNEAWARATKEGRPLVTIFVHHGCPECDKLDATLARPDAQHLFDNAVKARIEFTEKAEIVHRFGVKLTPTFLVFSPAHNGEVYREVGALSLERLQMLKPSIDGLVTEPRPEPGAKKREKAKANSDSLDQETSRTVASI